MNLINKLKEILSTKFSLKAKIISLVVVANFMSTAVFTYYFSNDIKNVIVPSIEKQSKVVAYGANNILNDYHNKIKDNKSISETEYKDILHKLSNFADLSEVTYVYSFMSNNGKIVYSSTSATKEEIEAKEYDGFFDEYEYASDKLKNIFKNNSMDLVYETTKDEYGHFHSVLIPFKNDNGITYVVGVDIEISHISEILDNAVIKVLTVGMVVFVVSVILFAFIINIFLSQIPLIKEGVVEFFKYINEESDTVKFIDIDSNDELGDMAKVINNNILTAQENILKDDAMINNIKEVSKLISNGSFKQRVDVEAHSPSYNESKEVINEMLDNVEGVVSKVVKIIGEYSRHNYEVVLDTESYEDELLELIESINTLGLNISEEKLQNAYDSISIQKSSNYLRGFIEDIIYLLNNISNDLEKMTEQFSSNEKFNKKILSKVQESIEEKNYLSSTIDKLKSNNSLQSIEVNELIKDMEYSLYKFEQTLTVVGKDLNREISDIKNFKEPLTVLNETVKENRSKAENTMKVASDLSSVSNGIRDSVVNCKFTGKDNINILMQYVDR
ncbi:MAG: methyl-accepting chemotaxis protein [Campylobacterota bacterium]|nr:methyl-accepting chemotaxis protein [Campylobacterota bacterium]